MKKIFTLLLLCVALFTSCKKDGASTKPVAIDGVSLNKTTTSISVGAKEILVATVTPEDATNKNVSWVSSNPAVATVSQTGEVSAIKVGSTNITVTSVADKTKSATCAVMVAIPAAVGNFYYADNTYLESYDATKTLIGIVFNVDANGVNGKIISLDELSNQEWSTEYVVTGATDPANGAQNMAKIKTFANWKTKYPIFEWCDKHTQGGKAWYLPAEADLYELHNFYDVLNASLNTAGATPIDKTKSYWSSTESYNPNARGTEALKIVIETGVANLVDKTYNDDIRTRAVATF